MDAGGILGQEAVAVDSDDDECTLHEKIQEKEHILFPRVVERVAKEFTSRVQ